MEEKIDRAAAGLAIAVVLTAIALGFPWWTTSAQVGGDGGLTATDGAGPFNDGDGLIETWEAFLAGFLTLVALVGLLAAFLSLAGAVELHPAWEDRIPAVAYVSGGALLLGLVIAVFGWPSDPGNFWSGTEALGGAISVSTSPGLGWYAGLLGGILGPVAVSDARNRGTISGGTGDPQATLGEAS
jgi:hypothetical protein